jgi:hypothetical protein
MSGIEYTPGKGTSPLAAHAGNQADFTYSMRPDVIAILDLDLGNKSVTNDIDDVLRKIEYYHQRSINSFKIAIPEAFGTECTGMDNELPFFPFRKRTKF